MTPRERGVFLALTDALAGTFTKAGHVALKNECEHLGYCSVKRCAPICIERRTLLYQAVDVLEAIAEPVQQDLFSEVVR